VDITGAQKDAEKLDKATLPHIHTTKSKKRQMKRCITFCMLVHYSVHYRQRWLAIRIQFESVVRLRAGQELHAPQW